MTDVTFPGESADYRRLRNELLAAERALKDQRERVAELRRQLPLGGLVETDYVFREGPADLDDNAPERFFETRLSQLFAEGKESLIVDHVMFEPDAERACPMCSMWTDGFNGLIPHLSDKVAFVVIAKAEIGKLRRWAKERGWDRVRLLSSRDNSFNRDFNVERDGHQLPGLSVFTRDAEGRIFHRYTTEGSLVFEHHRAMDLYSPVWNLFDLLPEGRGDWMPRYSYGGD